MYKIPVIKQVSQGDMMYSTVTIINNTASHSFSAFSFIQLFRMYFHCIGSLLRCVGLSCCGAQVQSLQAQQLQHAGFVALWHVGSYIPRPEIKPASPALEDGFFFFFLEDGFLTTEPPGKSPDLNFQKAIISYHFQEDDLSFCYDDCQRHLQEII